LDLKKYSDFSQYLQTISSGRKADFKLLSTVEISYNSSRADIADFLEMYSTTVPFKGAEDRELALTQVSNLIIQSIESGTGKLWLARDKSGHTISGVFFQEFANSLYYQFGASAPNELKYSPNAILLLRVIQEAFSAEINLIDFVGMNSPKRGSFKASFNPKPQLYFQIRIR
jgi:lipid II:glycine glycyltransferase (peptidoglycan interpeptide bridge formation enzyme)